MVFALCFSRLWLIVVLHTWQFSIQYLLSVSVAACLNWRFLFTCACGTYLTLLVRVADSHSLRGATAHYAEHGDSYYITVRCLRTYFLRQLIPHYFFAYGFTADQVIHTALGLMPLCY